MFDLLRLISRSIYYHRVSGLPARYRLAAARLRLRRMEGVARRVPFYRDRLADGPTAGAGFPVFDKAEYHQWDYASRVSVAEPEAFAERVSEALESHAAGCA